jgi:hypothetical protein
MPGMGKQITLRLDSMDVGQALDGLRCRQESWADLGDRRQKTDVRGQRSEVGGQRTEDRGQRTEDRGQRSEVRGQRTEDRGRRTEDGGQRSVKWDDTEVIPPLDNRMQPTPIRSSASLCFAQNDRFKISHSEKKAQSRLFLPLQKKRP